MLTIRFDELGLRPGHRVLDVVTVLQLDASGEQTLELRRRLADQIDAARGALHRRGDGLVPVRHGRQRTSRTTKSF